MLKISHKSVLMGHRKKIKMNELELRLIVVIIIIIAVEVTILLIGKGIWAIFLKVGANKNRKARGLYDIMEAASIMPLLQAVEVLRNAGMYYDTGAKWRGKQLRLPKSFWESAQYSFNAHLKARTILTIITSALNDKSDNMSRNIVNGILESLAFQARKTPARVIAVVGLLSQQVAGNTKLSVFSDWLDNMGIYDA